MKLAYVGKNEVGCYVASELCSKKELDFINILPNEDDSKIDFCKKELFECQPDYIIFSIDDFSNEEEDIVSGIYAIQQGINARCIILAIGYPPDSHILNSLSAIGLNMIVSETRLRPIADNVATFIEKPHKTDTVVAEKIIEDREKTIETLLEQEADKSEPMNLQKSVIKKADKVIRIACVGAMTRIGTTTIALQLTKAINSIEEHSAALLEFNKSGYVELIYDTYKDAEKDSALGRVVFAGVDMFYDMAKVTKILSEGYRYLVYDFGSIDGIIDITSILDKDIIILVGGCKPNEMPKTTEAMKLLPEQNNVFYVFSFVPDSDIKDLSEIMEECDKRTFRASYAPDPFKLNIKNSDDMITILNSDYERVDGTNGKYKRIQRLFGR